MLWAIFIARTGSPGRGVRPKLGIPAAMRPAEADEVLEGPRLERIQTWGLVATLATAVFIPAYWLPETQRQEAFQERFDEEAVHRGSLIYAAPPDLEEGIGAVEFKEVEEGIQLGQNCAFCHGGNLKGGPIGTGFIPPSRTGEDVEPVGYNAPPLDNVYQRWDEEVIRFTIERGRPGTPMPAWGVEYGGPMTEQMVTDVLAYLASLPENQEPPEELAEDASGAEIFEARCAVCHGDRGQGKEDDALWFQGMALWKGDVKHLTKEAHMFTVINGRRFAFMPQFGAAPPQGTPVPPYPLTTEQIEAVVEYERSL
jgi:mono/diheme cytochrome c family protein